MEQLERTVITREEAVKALTYLASLDLFDEEVENTLGNIAFCIQGEQECFHFWGGDADEINDLTESRRADLITDDWIKHCESIAKKYRYGQSHAEEKAEKESEGKE